MSYEKQFLFTNGKETDLKKKNEITLPPVLISAAEYLLKNHKVKYGLPSVFSQELLQKSFGQARPRFRGNCYIDVNDVIVARKVQSLLQ